MKVLGVLFKILLLLFGLALLIAGGLAGVFAIIEGGSEFLLVGAVLGMLGLILCIWVIFSFKKKPTRSEQAAPDAERDQP